jgi:type I restriction enzyme S subunit
MHIPLPPIKEQTQIATILSTIDRAIEQTEALIAKQQRIKTGLMQDLLTKGIDENGNIRSEETHEFKDSPLGRIPVEWEVVTTGQVTKSLVPGRDKPDLDGGGVPWITIPDIEGMYLDLPKSGLSLSLNAIKVANARLMPKGTVLMSCVGEFGIATITECDAVANQQLHGFICDQSILPEWLIAQINASGNRIDNMATQTTIKYLNKNGCESILITLPSLKEQVKIISILDNINDLFEKQKKSLNKLRSLKTGLMQDLLTGKVRVTELIKERETDNL